MLKRSFITKVSAAVLSLVMVMSLVACVQSEEPKSPENTTAATSEGTSTGTPAVKEPVTIQFYCNDTLDVPIDNPVGKAIAEKTGVTVNYVNGNDDKLKVMLAGGDVMDLNLAPKYLMGNVLDSGLALALDDLLKSNGANIEKNAAKPLALMRKFKSKDGKLYFIPTRTGDPTAVKGPNFQAEPTYFYLRQDYYAELGYPEMKTFDDLLKVMSDMQKAHPTTKEGKKTYGFSGFQDWGGPWNFGVQIGYGKGNINIDYGHSQTANNELEFQYTDPNSTLWQAAELYFKANKLGLLDPDFFINKYDNYKAKLTAGQIFTVAATWNTNETYPAMAEKGDKFASFESVPMPEAMPYNIATLKTNYVADGFGLFVSKKSKVADRVIDLLNFTFSPEGMRLLQSGVEGVHWETVDGKPQAKAEIIEQKKTDQNFMKNTGINLYEKLNGFNPKVISPVDNSSYDLFNYNPATYSSRNNEGNKQFSEHYGVEYPGELWSKMEKEGKIKPLERIDDIMALMPVVPADIKKIDASIDEYVAKNLPKVVLAKSEEASKAAKESIIAEIKKMKVDVSEQWWKTNFEKSKVDVLEAIK